MKRLLTFLIVALPFFASAALETQQAHSLAKLVSEEKSINPGKPIAVGLYLELEEGWHSYWSNPGDSGSAPIFKWTLPEGFSVKGPLYSTPQRILNGDLVSFGYLKEAFYRFEIENHLKTENESSIPLILDAEWLVCQTTCIPATFRFELTLPLSSELNPSPDAPLIARFQKSLPTNSSSIKASWKEKDQTVLLNVEASTAIEVLDVFPYSSWQVALGKPQIERSGNITQISFEKKGEGALPDSPALLVYREPGQGEALQSIELSGSLSQAVLPGFLGAFLFAFFGGLLLNLMPCVFPVLSIKVFSVLEQAGKGKAWVRQSSLVYAAGILVSFCLLGLVLAALRSWGEAVGWGFQLQNPYLLVGLIFLFLVLGVSFLDAIDLSWLQVGAGQSLTHQSGWMGEFFSGVLCVLVASPCTAPFMGAALGYAIAQPLPILLTVFLALGVGLSFPYLILALFPQAARILPRPGKWMETVKQAMAFPLFATVIWLLWILAQSATPFSVIAVLWGVLIASIGLWIVHLKKKKNGWRRLGIFVSCAGILASFWWVKQELSKSVQTQTTSSSHGIIWEPFSEQKAEELSKEGKAVFVDFTASWCVTCQVNEEVTFSSQSVKDFIQQHQIVMMKADWTKADPEITKALKSYDRIGVPFYVVYAPGSGKGRGLGEIMTPKIFKNAFPFKAEGET